jgi:outer membrane protein insertion porin family
MKAVWNLSRSIAAYLFMACAILPAALVVQALSASEAQAAVVGSVEVRGNQRIDDETIVNYVGIKPNVPFNDGDIDAGVKRLFSTGLFSDVRINVVSRTLVISVEEYAIINQVLFQGNKKLKDDALQRAIQLKASGTFSQPVLELDEQAIRDAYARIGRSDAVVSSQVIERRLQHQRRRQDQDLADQFRRQRSLLRPAPGGCHRDQEIHPDLVHFPRRRL